MSTCMFNIDAPMMNKVIRQAMIPISAETENNLVEYNHRVQSPPKAHPLYKHCHFPICSHYCSPFKKKYYCDFLT